MIKNSDMIFGIRAVAEAISAGKEVDKILIKKDLSGELATELFALIKGTDITVQRVPQEKLNSITRKNHQGVIAFISPIHYQPVEEIVASLYEQGKVPFFLVLDHLTDVRNFGAIARTAECAGVDAIIIPSKGSVSVTADAVKTSAGALMNIPVCRVASLYNTVKYLKSSGLQVVGASEKATKDYTEADMTLPLALVMGAEDKGISTEILSLVDTTVSLPQYGKIASLNVSVAAGVMIYEVLRQRR
ncbi:MAG: 23S rRNA (guanosine(2251)-2'-O)-methyltransferase RlmB [Muribaculaceae bacterium]|nr:23S rRNA (guanosine(2251)-2'-O)-methyltransferase RlmB [Muribaculaceae bacterium]